MNLLDPSRWSNPDNYRQHWALRAAAAAELVPNGMSILEIGTGTGFFRDYVQDRCIYVGADLYPLDDTVLAINLDSDRLPEGKFDYVVLLGVFEYLHDVEAAIDKVCSVSTDVVCSYCCLPKCRLTARSYQNRKKSGWVNHYTLDKFIAMFEKNGFTVKHQSVYSTGSYCDQMLMHFEKVITGDYAA